MARKESVLGLLAGLAVLAAASAHEVAPLSPAVSQSPVMPVIRRAPDFSLVDVEGGTVQLSRLRGRPVLVAFVYTSCTTACPLLSARMAKLQRSLARERIDAALLSVTVDPERDDAPALARFAKTFDARPGWHFLREAPERLRPVLAAYEEWTQRLADGELDHPARLHLVDPRGRVREIYSLAFFDEAQALIDMRALAREAQH